MSEHGAESGIIPENQTASDKTDSSVTNQHPPRPGQGDFEEGKSEPNVAGQGAGQLTEKDRERLQGNKDESSDK